MENSDDEIVCSFCNSPIKAEDEVCEKCGSDLMEYDEKSNASNKYSTLKFFSRICNILVIVFLILTLISFYFEWFLIINEILSSAGILLLIISKILGSISIIILLIVDRVIKVMIDLESNSRVQTRLLYKLIKGGK